MIDSKTLPGLLRYTQRTYENPTAFNFRRNDSWVSLSTKEFGETVKKIALGLHEMGIKRGKKIGLIAPSSPHWLAIDLAIMVAGGVSVPMFANVSKENLEFEVKDSRIKYLFVGGKEAWEAVKDCHLGVKKFITFDLDDFAPDSDERNQISLDSLVYLGNKYTVKEPFMFEELCSKLREEDLATIIYTSGSTGTPKGVELTQKNIFSQVQAAGKVLPIDYRKDKILSALPLAHIFERMVMYYYLSTGSSVYFADDVKKVGELVKDVKPTVMTVVPRLLEKVHTKMRARVQEASGLKKRLGLAAFKRAETKDVDAPKGIGDVFYRTLVYSKLVHALGGRLRLLISGGAPLPLEIGRFFLNIGLPLFEGYGLTESSPVLAVNSPGENRLGTVGKVFPGVQIKISAEGEILAWGPNIMRGYYKDSQATRETIDDEGWLHTGDLGSMDDDGFLRVTGRKKELFKTSTGKYVSPIPIEQELSKHELIDMGMVIAEGKKFISCLLVPDFEFLPVYMEREGFGGQNVSEFLKGPFIHMEIVKHIEAVNKHLNEWEKIRKWDLITTPISIDSGELTPSMKVRRHVVEEKYHSMIDDMYQESLEPALK